MRYNFQLFKRPVNGNDFGEASCFDTDSLSPLSIPELSDGFDSSLEPPVNGLLPVSYYTDAVPAGTYAIHIVLEAAMDLPQIFLFTGRKQLRDIISLKKGERYEKTFYQSAAEIIPRYHQDAYQVRHLFFTFCAGTTGIDTNLKPAAYEITQPAYEQAAHTNKDAISVISCYAEPAPGIPVIYLCGDSTVTDQSSQIPYHPGACYSSWGQALPAFLDSRTAVENQAHCGLTTETFREEGHMGIVKRYIRPGDYCLIQFGHNDQKLPHLLADREYPVNLKRYIQEVRAARATPVLVTSPGRNIWKPDGAYHELLAEHTDAVKQVAEETGTCFIDLHDFTVKHIISNGPEASCGYFYPGDYTHTNEFGAFQSAAFIARQLQCLYPETFSCRRTLPSFTPPPHLWDTLAQSGIRKAGTGQKEQFDAMEKSTAALLKAIETAKNQHDAH